MKKKEETIFMLTERGTNGQSGFLGWDSATSWTPFREVGRVTGV